MEQWIEFARGPLFAFTFLIMVLGLVRLLIVQIYTIVSGKGRRIIRAPWKKIFGEALSWVIPVKHLIPGTKVFSIVSFLCHIGLILVPLFIANHIVLWEDFLKADLPQLNTVFADYLTLFTITCLFILLGFRIHSMRIRSMSRKSDYILLVIILIPFLTGYLMLHPEFNPFPWNAMMLVHLLSAELLMVLIPFTKLAHVVLFFFDRISALHWQLRPGAGDRVAEYLYGKDAKV